MLDPIHVVLVDDHAMLRAGIRQLLETDEAIVVVGEAADGLAAQTEIAQTHPDVVLLDIKMPTMSGVDLTRWLRSTYPEIRILILTAFDDPPYVQAVLKSGANGYALKTASPAQLIQAVKDVYAGQAFLDYQIAAQLVGGVSTPAPAVELTERELDVLALAVTGLTNKQIGEKLFLSSRTVQSHFAKLFRKLGVNTRTEAVTKALSLGIIDHA